MEKSYQPLNVWVSGGGGGGGGGGLFVYSIYIFPQSKHHPEIYTFMS